MAVARLAEAKKGMLALDNYNDNVCLLRCIEVHRGGGGGRPFNTKRVRVKILSQLEHSVSEDNQKVFSADRAAFQTRYRSI